MSPTRRPSSLESITSQQELTKVFTKLDTELFNSYNRCDLQRFSTFLADDVEFYHDQTGLTVGKEKLINALKENIFGKVSRQLVPGSLEAYPMKGYGALQMGAYRFQHLGRDDKEPVSEAQFIHLWHYKEVTWKVARVISYDHHVLTE